MQNICGVSYWLYVRAFRRDNALNGLEGEGNVYFRGRRTSTKVGLTAALFVFAGSKDLRYIALGFEWVWVDRKSKSLS
jgi:hypothetical protein